MCLHTRSSGGRAQGQEYCLLALLPLGVGIPSGCLLQLCHAIPKGAMGGGNAETGRHNIQFKRPFKSIIREQLPV